MNVTTEIIQTTVPVVPLCRVEIAVQDDPAWIIRFVKIIGQFNRGLLVEFELSQYLVLDLNLFFDVETFKAGWLNGAEKILIEFRCFATHPNDTIRIIMTGMPSEG